MDGAAMSGQDYPAARELFEELAAGYLARPGVSRRRMFGREGLTSDTKFFAFLNEDQLLVKLPPATAKALVAMGAARTAETVSPTMRQWVLVPLLAGPGGHERWHQLMADAHAHAALRATTDATSPVKGSSPQS
jgi:TfoX/Sxy family transcriptional regulator of competence genes